VFFAGHCTHYSENPPIILWQINRTELLELTGQSTTQEAVQVCFDAHLPESAWVAITDGPHPAQLYSKAAHWKVAMPKIKVVNPIGAGDTCTGVMLYCIARGMEMPAAFAWGLAAACASCLHEGGAVFSMEDVHSLRRQMQIMQPLATGSGGGSF